jgi:hypothetical protein
MCVDRLTKFGEPLPEPGFTAPRTLQWANGVDFNTRDIEPNEPRRADLCYAVEGESVMHFFAGASRRGRSDPLFARALPRASQGRCGDV